MFLGYGADVTAVSPNTYVRIKFLRVFTAYSVFNTYQDFLTFQTFILEYKLRSIIIRIPSFEL